MATNGKKDNRLFSNTEIDHSIDKYLSGLSSRRQPSAFRVLHYLSLNMPTPPINLCGGMPHHSTFPIKSATFELNDGSTISIPPEVMQVALQYTPGLGYGPLQQKLRDLMLESHQPPLWEDRDVLIVSGAQEGLGKIVEMVVEEGDVVVIPEHCYTTLLAALSPIKPKFLSIPCDEYGMKVDILQEELEKCSGKARVKMLYVGSTGSNPTGITTSLQRRELIYQQACKHDFLIVEDDAYYFLNLIEEKLPPSFLQLDTDKRVLRIDTFSKSFGPGLRLGWITAPTVFIPRIQRHIHTQTIHPSSLSQAIVSAILEHWDKEGLDKHLTKLRAFYRSQRDSMVAAATRHLTGLAEWTIPSAGMFMWIKVLNIEDSHGLVHKDVLDAGVMLCPGNCFYEDPTTPTPYFRCSYSYSLAQNFDKAFEILARVIKEKMNEKK